MNYPWNCITIEFKDGTLDLECSNAEQSIGWFMVVQSICPLISHQLVSRAKLNWNVAALKLQKLAVKRDSNVRDLCIELIFAAKKRINLEISNIID